MHKNTYRTALGGVLSALAVAVMFFGSVLPFATIIAPAAASLCVLYFCLEFNKGTAFVIYVAISALSLLLSPDKELALIFVCFLGYYPIVKLLYEGKFSRTLAYVFKFVNLNVSIGLLYYVITRVFVLAAVREEFAQYTVGVIILLAVLGNITFFIFDVALTRFCVLYFTTIRPKLMKN